MLGLSGGIDSALVACIAARALGPENVLGVAMPSRYSSEGSLTDAAALAKNLGIDFNVISIEPMFEAYLGALAPAFADARVGESGDAGAEAADLAMQNLQARVRGAILMALSNRHGRLLLTTGNKSELATGYCTLYGDMAGGLAVISDVPKTLVYKLAREINRERAVIPRGDADQGAVRGAAPRSDRPGFAAALRASGRDPGRAPGTGAGFAGPGRRRVRRRDRERRGAPRATQRVQKAPDAAGFEDHRQGLRPRPAHADRAGLEGVTEALDVQL